MRTRTGSPIALRILLGAIVVGLAIWFGTGSGDPEPAPPAVGSVATSAETASERRVGSHETDARREVADERPTPAAPTLVRHGIARLRESGEPVPGAMVQVHFDGQEPTEVQADAEGRFVLGFPGPGLCDVQGSADGLVCEPHPGFRVAPDSELGELELMFREPASIRGRVVDQDGEPIAGATLWCRLESVDGWPQWLDLRRTSYENASSVTSGSDGEFAIEGLLPGRFRVSVGAIGFFSRSAQADTGPEPLRVVLQRKRPGLRVRMLDAEGRPVPVRRVMLESRSALVEDQWGPHQVELVAGSLESGEFEVELRHDYEVRVVVMPVDHAPVCSEPIERPRGEMVELRLADGYRVSGRLVLKNGECVPRTRIGDAEKTRNSNFTDTETDDEGRFVLHSMEPLNRIQASPRDAPFVFLDLEASSDRSRDIGDWVLDEGVTVRAYGPPSASRIDGLRAKLDGPFGEAARVSAARSTGGRSVVEWSDVPPGEGRVTWLAGPRHPGPMISVVEPVVVHVGGPGSESIDVPWPEPGFPTLEVVLDVDGRPASFMRLRATHEDLKLEMDATSGEDGRIAIHMPAGRVRLEVRADSRRNFVAIGEGELIAGTTTHETIRLESIRVQGRVIDAATGLPAPHAQIEVRCRRDSEVISLGSARSLRTGEFDTGAFFRRVGDAATTSLVVRTRVHAEFEYAGVLRFGPDRIARVGDLTLERGCELAVSVVGDSPIPDGTVLTIVVGETRREFPAHRGPVEAEGLPEGTAQLILTGPDGQEISRRTVELQIDEPRVLRWQL